MKQKNIYTSSKRILNYLFFLIFSVASIIIVFPPVQIHATALDQENFYFLTGIFSGNGYLIETNNSNIIGGVSDADSYMYYNVNYGYTGAEEALYNYIEYLNSPNNSYNARLISAVSWNDYDLEEYSTPVYFASEQDSYITFHSFDGGSGSYDIEVDEHFLFPSFRAYRDEYTSPAFYIPAGNYRFEFIKESYCYYLLKFSSVTEIPVDGNYGFIIQMYQQIKDKADEIGLAAQGLNADGSVNETKTVYYTAPSVNAEIIKVLMKSEGVTLIVTYNYEGYEFTSTITPEKAREMYREDITWYGPAYIAKFCSATWTGKTVE